MLEHAYYTWLSGHISLYKTFPPADLLLKQPNLYFSIYGMKTKSLDLFDQILTLCQVNTLTQDCKDTTLFYYLTIEAHA